MRRYSERHLAGTRFVRFLSVLLAVGYVVVDGKLELLFQLIKRVRFKENDVPNVTYSSLKRARFVIDFHSGLVALIAEHQPTPICVGNTLIVIASPLLASGHGGGLRTWVRIPWSLAGILDPDRSSISAPKSSNKGSMYSHRIPELVGLSNMAARVLGCFRLT